MAELARDVTFEWDVRTDHIDVDRWAQVVVRRGGVAGEPVTRFGTWPAVAILVLVALVAGFQFGRGFVVALLGPLVLVVGGVFLLARSAAARTAKMMRSVPAATEAFTFSANPSGTRWASATGSDQLGWERYDSAVVSDDLIVLLLAGGAVRVLPNVSLVTTSPPSEVVATISGWIEGAGSAPSA